MRITIRLEADCRLPYLPTAEASVEVDATMSDAERLAAITGATERAWADLCGGLAADRARLALTV